MGKIEGFTDHQLRLIKSVRCRATVKATGEQCKNMAVRGALVCRCHGMTKHAMEVAKKNVRARLGELFEERVPKALEVLDEVMESGTDDGLRVKAANSILDRASHATAKKSDVQVNQEQQTVDEDLLDILVEMRRSKDL